MCPDRNNKYSDNELLGVMVLGIVIGAIFAVMITFIVTAAIFEGKADTDVLSLGEYYSGHWINDSGEYYLLVNKAGNNAAPKYHKIPSDVAVSGKPCVCNFKVYKTADGTVYEFPTRG